MTTTATQRARALERAYLRIVVDPTYAAALVAASDDGTDGVDGLTPAEVAELLQLPADVIAVERRGRHGHLWDRARAHMPRTAARAERCLAPASLDALRLRLFTHDLWNASATFDLPPYGPGHELATPLRDAAAHLAQTSDGDGESAALRDLAAIERELFGYEQGVASVDRTSGTSSFDLRALLAGSTAAARELRLPRPMRWRVGRAGGSSNG